VRLDRLLHFVLVLLVLHNRLPKTVKYFVSRQGQHLHCAVHFSIVYQNKDKDNVFILLQSRVKLYITVNEYSTVQYLLLNVLNGVLKQLLGRSNPQRWQPLPCTLGRHAPAAKGSAAQGGRQGGCTVLYCTVLYCTVPYRTVL